MAEDKNMDNEFDEEVDQITLTLDDDTELVCDISAIYPCGDKFYIALEPTNGGEDSDIYLYQFIDHGDDDIELIDIEDDDEFEAASEAYDEFMLGDEVDEMFEDDDDDDSEN